jgi:hypothetical protein
MAKPAKQQTPFTAFIAKHHLTLDQWHDLPKLRRFIGQSADQKELDMALYVAVSINNLACVQALLQKKANPCTAIEVISPNDVTQTVASTAFRVAAAYADIDFAIATELHKAGAEVTDEIILHTMSILKTDRTALLERLTQLITLDERCLDRLPTSTIINLASLAINSEYPSLLKALNSKVLGSDLLRTNAKFRDIYLKHLEKHDQETYSQVADDIHLAYYFSTANFPAICLELEKDGPLPTLTSEQLEKLHRYIIINSKHLSLLTALSGKVLDSDLLRSNAKFRDLYLEHLKKHDQETYCQVADDIRLAYCFSTANFPAIFFELENDGPPPALTSEQLEKLRSHIMSLPLGNNLQRRCTTLLHHYKKIVDLPTIADAQVIAVYNILHSRFTAIIGRLTNRELELDAVIVGDKSANIRAIRLIDLNIPLLKILCLHRLSRIVDYVDYLHHNVIVKQTIASLDKTIRDFEYYKDELCTVLVKLNLGCKVNEVHRLFAALSLRLTNYHLLTKDNKPVCGAIHKLTTSLMDILSIVANIDNSRPPKLATEMTVLLNNSISDDMTRLDSQPKPVIKEPQTNTHRLMITLGVAMASVPVFSKLLTGSFMPNDNVAIVAATVTTALLVVPSLSHDQVRRLA